MFKQILKLSNPTTGKKDARSSQPAEIKRKRRKQSTESEIFIGTEEISSKPKRIKITQVKKHNVKGRPKKADKPSNWIDLNEVTHQASPKIFDMFERFQNFAQRRVLKRHPSGLLDSSVDETAKKDLQSDNQLDSATNSSIPSSERNLSQSSEPFPRSGGIESPIGGDRKRRCVENFEYDYEDEQSAQRVPQPASAFKPKCLNFDNIDDS